MYDIFRVEIYADSMVDEELITSSDGQSYDSETPIPSSVDHTPQVSAELPSVNYVSVLSKLTSIT